MVRFAGLKDTIKRAAVVQLGRCLLSFGPPPISRRSAGQELTLLAPKLRRPISIIERRAKTWASLAK
jgi:hypothetical protein